MSKELVEKKNDMITRAEELLNQAKSEQRALTEVEIEEINNIKAEVNSIDETLKLDDQVRAMTEMEKKEDNIKEEKREMTQEEITKETEINERCAFENYLRGRIVHERAGELTPATSGDNIGLGGALIPTTIVNYIIRKVYDICPILERSQKFNVKGRVDVPYYPADSDNITVAYQEEFVQMSSSSGSFATVTLGGFLAGALTKVSRSLINNVNFDIVAFVVDEMAQAIARFIEHELLIGTPEDTSTDPDTPAKVLGLSTLSNTMTATASDEVTADELIQLKDKVKDAFQSNAIWIMSPATRTAIRLLKDEVGRYLLQDDITAPFGSALLGKPVYVSDNMPNMASGVRAIYYGDMRGLGTKFSEQINIDVLRERYADEHAVGVIGWFEFDGKVIDEQKIACLVMKSGG